MALLRSASEAEGSYPAVLDDDEQVRCGGVPLRPYVRLPQTVVKGVRRPGREQPRGSVKAQGGQWASPYKELLCAHNQELGLD